MFVRVHVAPLFVERKSPKDDDASNVVLVGEPAVSRSTTMWPMRAPPVAVTKSSAPSCVHVSPPFVERKIPQP